ncbi:hypothetical protein L1049_000927 [Liquidambar formosana]|uniref:Transcription factor GTE4-like n=1 Tax=Liquidambar formosana TaxID=63359 RepID=A0AAP0R5Q4_LIQFO
MASGTLAGDDSREKHRWGDNKVYTRKHHKKGTKNINNINHNTNVPQQSSQTLATTTEDGNSSQPQNLSRFDAASDDSSSHNRVQGVVANGRELVSGNGNGLVPAFVRVENRVRVNLSAVRSKAEFRELRRKLVGELEQVRNLVKKLEAKEIQLNGYSSVAGYSHSQVSAGVGGYSHSQVSNEVIDKVGGGALRVNSEVGSVGQHDSRPFRGLTVSVMENSHGVEFVEKEKRTPKANQYYRNTEFVLGKEKFPPPESNKKLKANGFGLDKYLSQAFKNCSNLLAKLMKHKHGWVFNVPVDVKGLGLHDYYTIIKHPMDLGTVKSRLNKNWYKSPREFAEDVRLTFRNAMTYNPKGQDVYIMAEQLSKIFEEKWAVIEVEYNLDWRIDMVHDAGLPTPTSRKAPPSHHPLPPPPPQMRALDRSESMSTPVDSRMKAANFAPSNRMTVPKKPKAKDPHKRDMTYEEKQKLSSSLQSLPSEKLDNIVQIIKKRNLALSQHDDEIEVDIDSVDAETLWELDRFVTNYKKSVSKNKRKAELALQARAEPGHTIQKTNPAPVVVEAPRETKTVGEKTVSASPVRGEKQGDNVSRSSSSSSSSSDSGSSSSDSDSDSSSASGSDPGHSPRA